jgi:hypothetical protein
MISPTSSIHALLGCHICVMKRILGGWIGYSDGKLKRALKKPPSLVTSVHYSQDVTRPRLTRACLSG